MCELVWGELDTFVKKKKNGFGENTPFTGERPAKGLAPISMETMVPDLDHLIRILQGRVHV